MGASTVIVNLAAAEVETRTRIVACSNPIHGWILIFNYQITNLPNYQISQLPNSP